MVTISDARITFISAECFFEHLSDDVHDDDAELWDPILYELEFNRLRGGGAPDIYDFPWRRSQKSAFWRLYLGGKALGGVPAEEAWAAMVPLRLTETMATVETDGGERVVIDAYGYPYGLGVTLTVHTHQRASASLDEWQERLQQLRFQPLFRIQADDDPQPRQATLLSLLDELRSLYRQYYYPAAQVPIQSNLPISIANVLQASGGDPARPVDQELQRRLHAVTAWPADWHNAVLPPLGAYPYFLPLQSHNLVPGDALYAYGRGRVLWRPGLFRRQTAEDGPRRRHTLSCLGHNLVAGALQAEQLRLLAVAYQTSAAARRWMDPADARRAGRLLANLHAGSETYRSASVRSLIEESDSLSAVNALLALAGKAPIIPSPPPPKIATGERNAS